MPNPKIAEAGKATRFKPGNSANPGGRPKKKHITEAYEKSLLLKAPEDIVKKLGLPEGSRWADVMAAGMVRSAVKGNVPAAKEIADRIEGPVNEAVEGAPSMTDIAISVRYEDPKKGLIAGNH
jgi:hypothetical protein